MLYTGYPRGTDPNDRAAHKKRSSAKEREQREGREAVRRGVKEKKQRKGEGNRSSAERRMEGPCSSV